jgi:uncharacterized membrane protein
VLVGLWIAVNAAVLALRWDPYPFILLNLAFSTQAAYAAPLILLAQTRQAERDKASAIAFEAHRDALDTRHLASEARVGQVLDREAAIARNLARLLEQQAALATQIEALSDQLRERS